MITNVKNCFNYGAVILEEKILNSLTDAQKRVAMIVAGVFTLIAAIYLMIKFYPKISDRQAKKLNKKDTDDVVAKSLNVEIEKLQKQEPQLPKEPPSKIPTISGYGFIDRQRGICNELFTMLYDKKFFDPINDENVEKVIDDFGAFIQNAPFDAKVRVNIVDSSSQNIPKEALDKGCHYREYTDYGSGWGAQSRRELIMTHKFLRDFDNKKDDKNECKATLLKVVDELKEVLRLEEERKKDALRLQEKIKKANERKDVNG